MNNTNHIKEYEIRQKSQHKFHLVNPAEMPVESQWEAMFLSQTFYSTYFFSFKSLNMFTVEQCSFSDDNCKTMCEDNVIYDVQYSQSNKKGVFM